MPGPVVKQPDLSSHMPELGTRIRGWHVSNYAVELAGIIISSYAAEQFDSVKPKLPFGQLPTLKYEGELLCQSMTIARWTGLPISEIPTA